jgi:patatin-like phospholipase/acyl hydrolase
MKKKFCKKCGDEITDKNKSMIINRGYVYPANRCRKCINEYMRNYMRNNPEKRAHNNALSRYYEKQSSKCIDYYEEKIEHLYESIEIIQKKIDKYEERLEELKKIRGIKNEK